MWSGWVRVLLQIVIWGDVCSNDWAAAFNEDSDLVLGVCFSVLRFSYPISVLPGEEVVPEVHEVLFLVALALSLQTYFTMVDNFQEKITIVRNCQRSSKDTCNQARMLCVEFQQPRWTFTKQLRQQQKQNGGSWGERKHKQQQKPNSGGQVKPSHQVQDQQLKIKLKHCQRHNGPEGWVLRTKVTSLGHITTS